MLSFKKIEHGYIKPLLRRLKPYSRVRYGELDVYYKNFLDGGGTEFGQDFIRFLKSRRCPVNRRLFEWCAGPGFIGYSLLAHGFCESLCLADVNPAAVNAAKMTASKNALDDRVAVYLSDNLAAIPKTEKWDLIVSNPPHFNDAKYAKEIRWYDGGWELHREFFRDIHHYLAPGGVIVLQENSEGSSPETFKDMIETAGLRIVFAENEPKSQTRPQSYFYLGVMRKDDIEPEWVK